MRIFFLISVLIFSSTFVFSQEVIDPCYEKNEKLEEIYNILLNDKLKNFDNLKKQIKDLEKDLENCKNSSGRVNLQDLKYQIETLNFSLSSYESENLALKKKKSEFKNKIENLNQRIKTNATRNNNLKDNTKNEIGIIEKYNGIIDNTLINLIIKKADKYSLNSNKLKSIRKLNLLIKESEELLNLTYNSKKNNSQILKITNVRKEYRSDFLWHKEKLNDLIFLLNSYRDVNNRLFKFLTELEDYEEIDENLNDYIYEESIFYFNFPFLSKELTLKTNNLKYDFKITRK